jgi:hypothetical protein
VKKLLVFIAICGVAVPVTGFLTLVLFPFWDWFEKQSGIESLGHSGPADWCFVAVLFVTLCTGFIAWHVLKKKKPTGK